MTTTEADGASEEVKPLSEEELQDIHVALRVARGWDYADDMIRRIRALTDSEEG